MTTVKTQACTRCGQVKPVTYFNRNARSRRGYEAECRACVLKRRRRHEAITASPNGPEAVNAMVDAAPDREPAIRLREELERHRDAGRPWTSAWPSALSTAVRDLATGEAVEWRKAFTSTREAWHGAYENSSDAAPAMFVPNDLVAA